MGNLGLYETITTEAKLAGGVEAWIKVIEDAAVAERSSGYVAKGAAIGVLVTCAAAGTTHAVRAASSARRRQRELAAEARRRLHEEIAGHQRSDSDPFDGEPGLEETND